MLSPVKVFELHDAEVVRPFRATPLTVGVGVSKKSFISAGQDPGLQM